MGWGREGGGRGRGRQGWGGGYFRPVDSAAILRLLILISRDNFRSPEYHQRAALQSGAVYPGKKSSPSVVETVFLFFSDKKGGNITTFTTCNHVFKNVFFPKLSLAWCMNVILISVLRG